MSLLDQFIGVWAPHTCVQCGAEAQLLCPVCIRNLPVIASRCYHCRKITGDWRMCSACSKTSKLWRVRVGTIYEAAAKELVWRLKFSGAQLAAQTMATRLISLYEFAQSAIIVPVPTATSRVRRRGYDQARLLARQLSRQTGLPMVDCLARSGQAHQVGASRQQRLHQLEGAFRVTKRSMVRDAHLILVDDVITTGATLEAAAKILRQAGVGRVEALVFAQP